jgi:hypothetical protein
VSKCRALIVSDTGYAELRSIDADDLDVLTGVVGGWLEAIYGHDWHAFMDEDGKAKGLSQNVPATKIANALGWHVGDVLVGPVVFLGSRMNDGVRDNADVPADVIGVADALLALDITEVQS